MKVRTDFARRAGESVSQWYSRLQAVDKTLLTPKAAERLDKQLRRAAPLAAKEAEVEAYWQRRRQLYSTPAAAQEIGVTSAQFLRLARRLKIEPEGWYDNPHSKRRPRCPLWPPEEVQALVGGPEVDAARERARNAAKAKATKPSRRLEEFRRRYPSWEDAVPAAAEAMFSLNRYAKWRSCTREHREEIYALKNCLVRLLYLRGFSIGVRLHTIKKPRRVCSACDGSGEEGGEVAGFAFCTCTGCDGKGYHDAYQIEYVVFRFLVAGRVYCWHQPGELVGWRVKFTEEPSAWAPEPEEKELNMDPRRFAEAKALVRFVIGAEAECQSAE